MLAQLSSAAELISDSPSAVHGQARTPNCGLSGAGAAEVLQGLWAMAPQPTAGGGDGPGGEGPVEGVSRKDKSLGLLCDNFLQLFASGAASAVELEGVATALGVGRRRIYDIVNVLESLDVVHKDRTSAYTWLGISQLPACVERLSNMKPIVELLVDDPLDTATDKENSTGGTGGETSCTAAQHDGAGAVAMAGAASATANAATEKLEGRKEKSIRELSTKFVGLFLQSVQLPGLDGTLSLEQAARSLLMHENGTAPGGPEPDSGAMKTKVRRLYDICNVLTSLRMIEKIKLPDTSKPAFRWLGVTAETEAVFDSTAAANRQVKAYGGGTNAPVCSKRARNSLGGATSSAQDAARRTAAKTCAAAAPATSAPTAVVHAVPLMSGATAPTAPTPAYAAAPCAPAPHHLNHQTAATVVSHTSTAPTHEAILRAQAQLRHGGAGATAVQASVVCGAPATATWPLPEMLAPAATGASLAPFASANGIESPSLGLRKQAKAGCVPAPTPAHVQAQLLAGGMGLENTPRAATAALLTMAALRVESNEV